MTPLPAVEPEIIGTPLLSVNGRPRGPIRGGPVTRGPAVGGTRRAPRAGNPAPSRWRGRFPRPG